MGPRVTIEVNTTGHICLPEHRYHFLTREVTDFRFRRFWLLIDAAEYANHRDSNSGYNHYRCSARDFERKCPQGGTRADGIEEQVLTNLKTLKPPADWRKNVVASLGQLLGDKQLEDRIAEIKTIIERMDFRWDHGLITDQDAYL